MNDIKGIALGYFKTDPELKEMFATKSGRFFYSSDNRNRYLADTKDDDAAVDFKRDEVLNDNPKKKLKRKK